MLSFATQIHQTLRIRGILNQAGPYGLTDVGSLSDFETHLEWQLLHVWFNQCLLTTRSFYSRYQQHTPPHMFLTKSFPSCAQIGHHLSCFNPFGFLLCSRISTFKSALRRMHLELWRSKDLCLWMKIYYTKIYYIKIYIHFYVVLYSISILKIDYCMYTKNLYTVTDATCSKYNKFTPSKTASGRYPKRWTAEDCPRWPAQCVTPNGWYGGGKFNSGSNSFKGEHAV